MISESERREVAERLMDNVHEYGTEYNFFLYALGMEREYHGPCDWTKVHERLADLIDPTCRFFPTFNGGFGCDRCYTWIQSMKTKPNYCPICGARVVSDDE